MNTPFPKFLTGILILAALIRLVPAAEPPPFLDTWLAAQTNIHTWTADAIQTRSIKTFAQPLVSTGKVWVVTPNHFRWSWANHRRPSRSGSPMSSTSFIPT